MVAVPTATPVTTPAELTLAIDALLELHVPPVVASVSVVVTPVQTDEAPDIAPIVVAAFTTIVVVREVDPQLFVTVYDIVAVPALIPVTTPEALIVATEVAELLQVPPVVASLSVAVAPAQIVVVPVIMAGVAGGAVTTIPRVADTVPQLLEMV